MRRVSMSTDSRAAAVFYIVFMVGALGFSMPSHALLMSRMTPVMLWACGLLVAWQAGAFRRGTLRFWFITVGAVTFAIEIIGVQTGLIFGSYTYGPALGWRVGGVPVVIGLNWVLVIMGCAGICHRLRHVPALFACAVALCTVAFDVLLEPVAIRSNWWQWQQEAVPLRNYIAWFLISLGSAFWFGRLRVKIVSALTGHYLAAQAVFLFLRNVLP